MFSTRKTWDLSHAPCLQELWKKDVSLDASSVDFLMSDGEDDGSFLSLPTAAFSQRPSLTAELTETNAPSQQLLIQTLQDKVCEFQARLRSEEVTRHLLLQQLQQHSVQEKTSVGGSIQTSAAPNGVRVLQPGEPSDRLSCPEEEQLVTRLRTQVEELEEKLLDQTQEVERLRSELGATDLEKQLELLVVENQRLKQELKSCRSSELQSLDAAAETCSCSHCPHSQDAESLRREVSRWESQARQRERRLAELERELLEKSSRAESLRRQLDESTRQLDDGRRQLEEARRRQKEAEQKLSLRLQECEEELARQAATPPRVKYVTHTVEVESADSQKALAELQTKNAGLQEQLSVQRQLLRELETQLHESQRTCAQLRTQILVYEGEMERAQGQLEAEMQNLEEEKNRVIEEAFIRAESEMKAVHENLAGVRMNLLSLQPALRTLTCDYNCLKRQVQDFPFMLDKAITEAKQEICQVISEVSSTNQELLRKYKREMNLRKKCHNELVRLKGNIRVFCKKLDAERFAAAAACLKLKEIGVIGQNNQVPSRTADGRTGGLHSALCDEDDILTDDFNVFREKANVRNQQTPTKEEVSQISEALSLFPQPKDLLHRVVQLATSNRVKEVVQFKTRRGISELTLHWPEKMTFSAKAKKGVTAEKMVAALACMKLKELKLLDDNNKPLNHVKYHQEKVKELANQQKRPVPLEIPDHLLESIKEYHTQYPVEAEVQKVWDEEEVREQQTVNEEEDEDLVKDAITGKLYRPLSEREAQQLSAHLQEEWETANPVLSVKLPADAHRQQVVSAVQSSRVVVIAGETGCGKTTRIPRFLLEECVRSGNGAECNILVTQPRRISAVSVAQRVAQEMGPDLKHSVGYQVRLESKAPEHSGGTMLFVTVGILLRKMQSNPSLKGISHVVVDEVHERDINTDLLLALLRSSLEKNPNLRVVLMSATGDKRRLAEYFGGCPVVEVPGFMHPVRDRYLEDVLKELGHQLPVRQTMETEKKGRRHDIATDLKLVADVIEHIDRHGEPGAVLCFLPGWQDIRAVQEELMERPRFSSGSQIILSLHSSLSVQDQQVVFQRPQVGQRKIVLATNIAETSITIDDIVHVVDTGTHKEQTYDPLTKVSCLDTVWISRSNVTQRKGRAGRCQPGHSYHLFPRKQLETMAHFAIPEILRTPLENLVMQAKIHSPNCKTVDFLSQVLDSPELEAVKVAVQNLEDIGVLDKMENLTPLGKSVSYMSCDPRLGKLLVLGVMYRCALPMLSVAACLTRDPFYNSLLNRAQILKVKEALSDSGYSDYLAFIRAVSGWRKVQQEGARADRENYLHKHTLSGSSLRFINGLIYQFSSNLQEAQLVSHAHQCLQDTSVLNEHSNQDELLKAVLLAGFYPNLIQVKKGGVAKGRFRPNSVCFHTVTGPVQLNRTVNSRRKEFPSRWLTFFSAVKSSGVVFIRDSSVVHPLALLLFTDCDILETVKGDKVVLSLPGHTLVHCELSVETWDLLWDLRTSMQTMLYRNFSNPSNAIIHSAQDKKLISLLVELLNNTNSSPFIQNDSDSEVD